MLAAIWAQSRDGAFGAYGRLPWDLPEDLQMFKRLTMGSPVLMGRATWESLPRRPLPGRRNVVLSGRDGLVVDGAEVLSSVEQVLVEFAAPPELAWCIGGRQVLAALMPHLEVAVVTVIDADIAGDVRAPQLGERLTPAARHPVSGWLRSRTGADYAVTEWRRAGSSAPAIDLVPQESAPGTRVT